MAYTAKIAVVDTLKTLILPLNRGDGLIFKTLVVGFLILDSRESWRFLFLYYFIFLGFVCGFGII